jgi:hypothetical protein
MTAPRHTSSRITPKGTRPKGVNRSARRHGTTAADHDVVTTPWHDAAANPTHRPGRTAPGRGAPRRSGHRGGR